MNGFSINSYSPAIVKRLEYFVERNTEETLAGCAINVRDIPLLSSAVRWVHNKTLPVGGAALYGKSDWRVAESRLGLGFFSSLSFPFFLCRQTHNMAD